MSAGSLIIGSSDVRALRLMARETAAALNDPYGRQLTTEQRERAGLLLSLLAEGDVRDKATEAEVARAREEYAADSDNDVKVEDWSYASRSDEGTWITAQVWLGGTS